MVVSMGGFAMTRILVVAITLGIIFADFALLLLGFPTISRELHDLAKAYPIIAAGFGVLIGHWFWPMRSKNNVE